MQHCPTCGAENEDEAQFCAECGAPLDVEAEAVPVDDEPTLLSTNISELIEAQRTEVFEGNNGEDDEATIQISSEEIIEAVAEEPSQPGSPPLPSDGNTTSGTEAGGSNGWMSQRNIIIAIVVLLVLCCCFFAIVSGGLVAFSEEFAQAISRPGVFSLLG